MRSTLLSTLLFGFISSAVAFDCPEAARFGFTTVEPATGTLAAGQTITVTSNFTCSFSKGIHPSEVNYYIHNVVNNNGHELPTFVARRTNPGAVDTFETKIPFAPVYFVNASYSLLTQFLYPVEGSNGDPVLFFAQAGGEPGLKIANNTIFA